MYKDVLILVLLAYVKITTGEETYNAAIVEYQPYDMWTEEGGRKILFENTKIITEFSTEAKLKNADIIVFPEYGLTGLNLGEDDDEFDSICQIVPAPEDIVVPCDRNINTHTYDALRNISCVARNLQLYMVVNVAEKVVSLENETNTFYNTQVVFARNGTIIARYRKKHLFFEPHFTAGMENYTTAVFTTDFGVTFALMICFDIMYEEPSLLNIIHHNITNVVMSTYWIDELPFLTAPQIFAGWSTGLGINLLVSNYYKPENGAMGSGIFSGKKNEHNYVYDTRINSTIIVQTLSNISINNNDTVSTDRRATLEVIPEPEEEIYHSMIYENMENYTFKVLEPTESPWQLAKLCDHHVCCTANYSYTEELPTGETYQIIVYDGIVGKGGGAYLMRVQTCAVVYCMNDSNTSCANLNNPVSLENNFKLNLIEGQFTSEFIYPSIFNLDFTLFTDFIWERIDNVDSSLAKMMLTNSPNNLLSATLFARHYQEDP